MKKIEEKKYLGDPTPPEDEVICLFAGLLPRPDMVLRLQCNPRWDVLQFSTGPSKLFEFPGLPRPFPSVCVVTGKVGTGGLGGKKRKVKCVIFFRKTFDL